MKLKGIFILLIFVLIVGCSNQNVNNSKSEYTVYDIQVEDKLYLGNEQAENEILLAFDYACIWCKKWISEMLPQINDSLIANGTVKYYSQPLSLLSEKSLYMANIDYMIKMNAPADYFNIQYKFALDSEIEGWGTEAYIEKALNTYNIDSVELIKNIVLPDSLTISRTFTKQYGVESVPTVFVNNMQVEDPFNIEEITSLLK